MTTLCAQAILIDELLVDGYQFVRAARLRSDAIERCFTQYSQMSGRRFLVSLKEVINSERILKCWLLIEVDIDFWEKHLKTEVEEFEISIKKHSMFKLTTSWKQFWMIKQQKSQLLFLIT